MLGKLRLRDRVNDKRAIGQLLQDFRIYAWEVLTCCVFCAFDVKAAVQIGDVCFGCCIDSACRH